MPYGRNLTGEHFRFPANARKCRSSEKTSERPVADISSADTPDGIILGQIGDDVVTIGRWRIGRNWAKFPREVCQRR
jgi:hypothetical protein